MNILRRILNTHCLFHRLTGLYCPGCGGKRSVYLLFHGHPLLSLWYHPLVIYGLVVMTYYIFLMIRRKIFPVYQKKPYPTWPLWGAAILLFANCFLKNLMLVFFHIQPLSSNIY